MVAVPRVLRLGYTLAEASGEKLPPPADFLVIEQGLIICWWFEPKSRYYSCLCAKPVVESAGRNEHKAFVSKAA